MDSRGVIICYLTAESGYLFDEKKTSKAMESDRPIEAKKEGCFRSVKS
jgi:hypothetical protein